MVVAIEEKPPIGVSWGYGSDSRRVWSPEHLSAPQVPDGWALVVWTEAAAQEGAAQAREAELMQKAELEARAAEAKLMQEAAKAIEMKFIKVGRLPAFVFVPA